MKRFLFPAIFCLIFLTGYGQEQSDQDLSKNELKLNLAYGLFEIIEISYERILNNNMGVGFSGAYFLDDGSDLTALALPFFRFYTSDDRHAKGFFIEANSGLVVSETEVITIFNEMNQEEEISVEDEYSFGFGVAVGGKFVSDSGLFGEIYGGIGREFRDASDLEVYPRVGLVMGYRF